MEFSNCKWSRAHLPTVELQPCEELQSDVLPEMPMAPPESDSEACDPIEGRRQFRQHMELEKDALVSISSFRSSNQATGWAVQGRKSQPWIEVNPFSPKVALQAAVMAVPRFVIVGTGRIDITCVDRSSFPCGVTGAERIAPGICTRRPAMLCFALSTEFPCFLFVCSFARLARGVGPPKANRLRHDDCGGWWDEIYKILSC